MFDLKISYLTPGEYYLKAFVKVGDLVTFDLSAGPIEVKAGAVTESVLIKGDQ